MDSKQTLELTIRAANLIKQVATLIGMRDERVASMVVNQLAGEVLELSNFLKGRPSSLDTPER